MGEGRENISGKTRSAHESLFFVDGFLLANFKEFFIKPF